MYNSLVFSIFTVLRNHHLYQNIFITPKGNLTAFSSHYRPLFPIPFCSLPKHLLSPRIGLFWAFNTNGITRFMAFCICFVLICIFFVSIISLLFKTENIPLYG